MGAIAWETDMKSALVKAQAGQQPVFADFFNPGWIGCQQMDAVTYPQKAVQEFLADNMVPVRIPFDSPLSQEFRVPWLPMLITLDWNGAEHYRTVGFMAPDELVPSLMLGCAKAYCDCGLFDKAFARLGKLLSTWPESETAAEAMFFRGVCSYKSTHDPATLKEAFEQMTEQYPHSQWTKRAYPYRLLWRMAQGEGPNKPLYKEEVWCEMH